MSLVSSDFRNVFFWMLSPLLCDQLMLIPTGGVGLSCGWEWYSWVVAFG